MQSRSSSRKRKPEKQGGPVKRVTYKTDKRLPGNKEFNMSKRESTIADSFRLKLKSHATLDEFIAEQIINQMLEEEYQDTLRENFPLDEAGGEVIGTSTTERRQTITGAATAITDIFHVFDSLNLGFLSPIHFKDGMNRIAAGPVKVRILQSSMDVTDDLCERVYARMNTAEDGFLVLREWLDFFISSPQNNEEQFIQEIILAHAGVSLDDDHWGDETEAGSTLRLTTNESTLGPLAQSDVALMQNFVRENRKKDEDALQVQDSDSETTSSGGLDPFDDLSDISSESQVFFKQANMFRSSQTNVSGY